MIKSMLSILLLVGGTQALAADAVKWVGCGISKKAFMTEAAKAYEAKTGVKIRLSGGGATRGIRSVALGDSDMGGSCRHIIEGEEKEVASESYVVAWDVVVPIVHPDNKVSDISTDNLKKVLKGEVKNWKELGGEDKAIELILRKGNESGVGFMGRALLFDYAKGKPDPFSKSPAKAVKSTGPLEKEIVKNKYAFGITGVSSARKRKVKILKIDGGDATDLDAVAAGKVSTVRPLYVMVPKKTNTAAVKFVEWLLTKDGQAVIESQKTLSFDRAKKAGVLKKKFKHWGDTSKVLNFKDL